MKGEIDKVRDEVAEVAEKVMGWRQCGDDDPLRLFVADGGLIHNNRPQYHVRGLCFEPWHPDENPSHDYTVLVRVRETWDIIQRAALGTHLRGVWNDRTRGYIDMTEAMYVVGDYSRAALAVLKASQGGR